MLSTLLTALQLIISPILLLSRSRLGDDLPLTSPSRIFTLRHEHAIANSTNIIFADVPQSLISEKKYTIKHKHTRVYRPTSLEALKNARRDSFMNGQLETAADLWVQSTIPAPDDNDRESLLTLAKMSNNAYYTPGERGWHTLDPFWGNTSYPIGWEPDADGFRGHIFVSEDESTVVLSVKGTSAGWIVGGGGPTVKKDKLNDNLMFSCCCSRVGPTWSPVCDCYSSGNKCEQSCVQNALTEESLFYNVAINLYNNITRLYPNADIWLTGHSLGGSLASLIGATFGAPVIAFEAIPEKLTAARLHLPTPPSTLHISHVYHTADPIAMGVCNGVSSYCAIGGYALETKCHLGKNIKYDTVEKFKWRVDISTHSIERIIDDVLSEDWEPPSEESPGRSVPEPVVEEDCEDCYNWEFGDFKFKNADEM